MATKEQVIGPIDWLRGWGTVINPGRDPAEKAIYVALVQAYVDAWLALCNAFRKSDRPFAKDGVILSNATSTKFTLSIFLDPPVIEGQHPPGKGYNEGFFEHLIPPPPPPPPDGLE